MIEGFVTPEAMSAMIKRGKMEQAKSGASESDAALTDWSIDRKGISRFTAVPTAPSGEKVPTMVFDRNGLDWKLVAIELPEGGLDPTAED
jgi:hypothetical protein